MLIYSCEICVFFYVRNRFKYCLKYIKDLMTILECTNLYLLPIFISINQNVILIYIFEYFLLQSLAILTYSSPIKYILYYNKFHKKSLENTIFLFKISYCVLILILRNFL